MPNPVTTKHVSYQRTKYPVVERIHTHRRLFLHPDEQVEIDLFCEEGMVLDILGAVLAAPEPRLRVWVQQLSDDVDTGLAHVGREA